ncbi:MAG: hypothetical protein M0P13_11855, partial [Fibrobacteraceae bacterium]|nr:hypothetical protein [Fibrobacteraceae bacterium]
ASLSATLNLGDFDASRHHCGSVIQPSELGCATLTLHGIDALRHRLHFGHAQACLSATLNLGDFIVRCCISAIKTSKLAFSALDLQAVHFTKAIFRGTHSGISELESLN